MNLETKITIYKFTPQVFTLTPYGKSKGGNVRYVVNRLTHIKHGM